MTTIFYGEITTESTLVFTFLMFTTFVIGNLIYMILRALIGNRLPPVLSKVFPRLITYLIYALALYIGLSRILGINVSTVVAALGIAGILIAISSQQILQNIFAGIIIALERPIKIGDWVEIGGFPSPGLCRVRDMTLLRTILRSINGNIVIISNSTLISSNIINYSRDEFLRISAKISLPLSADLEKAKYMILEVCKGHEKILPNVPKKKRYEVLKFVKIPSLRKILEAPTEYSRFQPVVNVKEITESSVVLEISFWIWEVNSREAIVSDLLQKVLVELNKNKL